MPGPAYRPEPSSADADLERRAAEGRQRIADATAKEASAEREAVDISRDVNLRAALGRQFGSPVRSLSTAILVLSVGSALGFIALAFVHDAYVDDRAGAPQTGPFAPLVRLALQMPASWGWIPPIAALALTGSLLLRFLVPPLATRRRVDAERAWMKGLPFAMEDYFEVLSAEPASECSLTFDLTWREDAPGLDVVQGILGTVDTASRAESTSSRGMRLQTGVISGSMGVSVRSGGGAYRTVLNSFRVVGYVHRLVDDVLLPLHRSHALERVSIARSV